LSKRLHQRTAFEAFAGSFPGATLNEQWGSLTAKVGGKVFCLRGEDSGEIVFKVSELAFDGLVELDGIGQAFYFAKRQWVRVEPGALEEELLKGYIGESYRMISGKLTRKLRAELGLD
jgi:predicted DNA-binding protein (MmcQ/YjbR family)